MSFTKKIIVSMILGILIGITFNLTSLLESSSGTYVINLLVLVSYLFLSSLKLIIVPLIFFSIDYSHKSHLDKRNETAIMSKLDEIS